MVYFLIGTPVVDQSNDVNKTWTYISKEVVGQSCQGNALQVDLSKFKLGNLDNQFHQGELMQKLENQIEGLLRKIDRQYLDIIEKPQSNFKIEGADSTLTIDQFLNKFKWSDKQFPRTQPLQEIVSSLQKRMNVIDADFRQKSNSYQEKKNVQSSLAVKEGNLYIKDLSDVLKPGLVRDKDFYYTDNITTLIAVVPKNKEEAFLQKYQVLSENVLPDSAKKFPYEDKENLQLYRIFVYKKDLRSQREIDQEQSQKNKAVRTPVEKYMAAMRDAGFTLREFTFNKAQYEQRENARDQIKKEAQTITTVLMKICQSSYSDLYNTYMHLKHLRLVVDIASRFGQREPTMTAILQPTQGKEQEITKKLTRIFCFDNSQLSLYGTKEELEDTDDFFPFVYIPINIY